MYQVYVPTRSHVSMYFYPLPKPRATALTHYRYNNNRGDVTKPRDGGTTADSPCK